MRHRLTSAQRRALKYYLTPSLYCRVPRVVNQATFISLDRRCLIEDEMGEGPDGWGLYFFTSEAGICALIDGWYDDGR